MGDLTFLLAQSVSQDGMLGIVDKVARTPLSIVVLVVGICTAVRLLLNLTVLKPVPYNERIYLSMSVQPVAKFVDEFMDAIIYAGVFVFLVIRPFILQTFFIPSGSMVQTLLVHDYIVANKFVYRVSDPQFGDIVVFKPPKDALLDPHEQEGDTDYIKRLIGLPGDVIEWKNLTLYRNGEKVVEPYVSFNKPTPGGRPAVDFTKLTTDEIETMVPKYDFKLVNYKGGIFPANMMGDFVNDARMPVAERYRLDDVREMATVKALPAAKVPEGYYLMMGDNRNGSFDSRGWGLVPKDSVIGRAEFIWFPISRMGRTR
ncbi:MAG: signal peptidase I [Armatimonadetes bacterium]|nr:signal peptidase I [Armatimonadota bacterium]